MVVPQSGKLLFLSWYVVVHFSSPSGDVDYPHAGDDSSGRGPSWWFPNRGSCCFFRGTSLYIFLPQVGMLIIPATGQDPLFLGLFFGGWQNIKKREVFAAARLDVGPFSYYLFITFSLLF